MAVEPTVEVSDTTVTVAHEGVEPMEDVEEMKVAPTRPTTTNTDSSGNGGKAKKKKNADGRKKNSDEATVSEAPKMMYAIKKPGTLTSNAISAEESKKQTAPTMTTNSNKTSREHHKMNNNVGQTSTKTVAR